MEARSKLPHLPPLAAALLLGLAGCDVQERYEPTVCAERCFQSALYKLSSVDHEQPSAAAIHEVREQCWSTASPCCAPRGCTLEEPATPEAAPGAGR